MSPTFRSTYTGVTLNSEGGFLCKCGYQMKEYTVNDTKSPYKGKQCTSSFRSLSFEMTEADRWNKDWACRRFSNDDERCKSWIWFEEATRVEGLIPRPAVPRTPKKQLDIRRFGLLTPTSSSGKRKRVNNGGVGVDGGGSFEDISDDDAPSEITDSPSRNRKEQGRREAKPPIPTGVTDAVQFQPRRRLQTPPVTIAGPSIPRVKPSASGLFTPGSGSHRKQWQEREPPMTPTKQNRSSASATCLIDDDLSDSDSYGWDEDLASAMLDHSGQ
ncbi:hypothetical protein BBP40_009974 [Aspergillus hancockii]|nr:hypothetical protein BBP40_009974 [Aspergillus hancockii]